MTKQLYATDAYLTKQEVEVTEVTKEGIVLDKTIFYPQGGGQPTDRGYFELEGKKIDLKGMKRAHGKLIHLVDEKPPVGSKLTENVDWEYRYKLMKHHTSLHVLSAVVFRKFEAKVTGGTIYEDKARLDFDLVDFNKELAASLVDEVNEELAKDHKIEIDFLPRDEADKNPDLIRTKVNLLPKTITEIRIVKIGDVDFQADGGLHVNSTKEIGSITLGKVQNKGKGRKRITISVDL